MKKLASLIAIAAIALSYFAGESHANEPEFQFVIAQNGLWMRETPDPAGKQITLIPYNARVKFIERKSQYVTIAGISGRWMKVTVNGKTGWVFGAFVSWEEAGKSMPADLFGYWVKDTTKTNSMQYFFDINTMSITLIFGQDATTHTSWFIEKWTAQGEAYVMEFTNNDREKKTLKMIHDKKARTLTITEEGSSDIKNLVRKP